MKWMILLALIPLSRILFYVALWLGHRTKNMEDECGINIARQMLTGLGLQDKVNVALEGNDDCYDPSKNTISLSEKNNRRTVASAAIAIHEVGHALQMNAGWRLYQLRCKMIIMEGPLICITAVLVLLGFAYKTCNILAIISFICLIIYTVALTEDGKSVDKFWFQQCVDNGNIGNIIFKRIEEMQTILKDLNSYGRIYPYLEERIYY